MLALALGAFGVLALLAAASDPSPPRRVLMRSQHPQRAQRTARVIVGAPIWGDTAYLTSDMATAGIGAASGVATTFAGGGPVPAAIGISGIVYVLKCRGVYVDEDEKAVIYCLKNSPRGLTEHEIAAMFGMPVANVLAVLHRLADAHAHNGEVIHVVKRGEDGIRWHSNV